MLRLNKNLQTVKLKYILITLAVSYTHLDVYKRQVSEAAPATKVVGSYGVDGKAKRIAAPKGLRLDKLANGKVKKVVVK